MSQKIQLYSLATPNGQKIGIALEEMGLPYDAHTINIMKGGQFKPEFIKINPNSKIPALVDPGANSGEDFKIFESGAILVYLANKSGKFLPKDEFARSEVMQWLFFQMGGAGPMFGQFGHFYKFAKDKCDHPYPLERYSNESKRLLKVIDTKLAQHEFIAGKDLSIADFALMPWVVCLDKFYGASEHLGLKDLKNITRWQNNLLDRPAVQKGMKVCQIPH